MANVAAPSIALLALGELETDPRIARRLPADLARRLQALPIAEDGGRITVAMADPADTAARDALAAALGSATCVVQADPGAIDLRLTAVWRTEDERPTELWVIEAGDGALRAYAQALAGHLRGRLRQCDDRGAEPSGLAGVAGSSPSLSLFQDAQHPWLQRQLASLSVTDDATPRALLIAEQPRWPLRSILVVLWGDEADQGAIDWAQRMAQPGNGIVTVLAVVPPVPAMYHGCAAMEQGLPGLLSSATPLGSQTRRAARRLAQAGINCTLRLRQGSPDWEIAREVNSGDYDLVIVTSRPTPWWLRWLEGDLVGELLRTVGRPLLIAKPAAG